MGFSKTSLSLFFFILFSSSYATSRTIHHQEFPSTTKVSPNNRAEKLIRSFNLFPKDPVNIIHGNHSLNFVPGKIVEKKFSFFGDSDEPSIENLGHHAGYYSLPRSNSAR
jgi:serine carboxypeptidase-like clade 4